MLEAETPINFTRIQYIDISQISPNENNPREPIQDESILDLMESIEEVGGVLVPLVVYERKKDDYLLIDGERRWRASKNLALKDKKYSKVPVNIIEKDLTPEAMIRLMFNIHMARKNWSKGAIAEVIGNILEKNPEMSSRELANKYKIDLEYITYTKAFIKMPKDMREKALIKEIDEYYLIYISSGLSAVQSTYPEIIEEYKWDYLAHRLYEKVEKGYVSKTRDFELIGKTIRNCIKYDAKDIYKSKFTRMIKELNYTPHQAAIDTNYDLGSIIEVIFISNCQEFIKFINGTKKSFEISRKKLSPKLIEILKDLRNIINEILKLGDN